MDHLDGVNTIWFAGWLIAVAVLFTLGLRLPLMPRLRRLPALAYAGAIVAATLGLSAILLKDATPYETALVLIQAACILALVAVLEGVGRGRPRG